MATWVLEGWHSIYCSDYASSANESVYQKVASRSGFIPSISSSLTCKSAKAHFESTNIHYTSHAQDSLDSDASRTNNHRSGSQRSQKAIAARLWRMTCIQAFQKTRPVRRKVSKIIDRVKLDSASGTVEERNLSEASVATNDHMSDKDKEQHLQDSGPGEDFLWGVESLGSIKMLSSETNAREQADWFEWD